MALEGGALSPLQAGWGGGGGGGAHAPGAPPASATYDIIYTSLVPRPYEGEERVRYTLLAHAPGAPENVGYRIPSYT